MIATRNICKYFGSYPALNNTSINVPKGSVYGLVGPNGAGKTTLIRHLAGVMLQDSGEVLIDGQPVYENSLIKSKMAHIPDDLYFFPGTTIKDMMHFYKGIYSTFDSLRFKKLASAFSLDLNKPIMRFSKGMQKQAAIWLSLCWHPEIILLDEPVDGLDPVMRRMVWSLIMQDVAESETTVFVSSHNLRELEDVCSHVGIMDKGSILIERSMSDLQTNIIKLQAAFSEKGPDSIGNFDILHTSQSGRVYEYIIRGNKDDVVQEVVKYSPLIYDILPLSLEEIFIYELGGMDYAEIII